MSSHYLTNFYFGPRTLSTADQSLSPRISWTSSCALGKGASLPLPPTSCLGPLVCTAIWGYSLHLSPPAGPHQKALSHRRVGETETKSLEAPPLQS